MPAAMYAPTIPPPRPNGVAMGMVAGTTMAMSAGESHVVLLLGSEKLGSYEYLLLQRR